MEGLFQKIREYIKTVRLTDEEKNALRAQILIYTEKHPVHEPSFFVMHRMAVSFAILVLLIIGTPFAAERSLPNDLLYTVKLSVNDTFVNDIAFLDRRLSEGDILFVKGELNEEKQNRLSALFQEKKENILKDDISDKTFRRIAMREEAFNSLFGIESATEDSAAQTLSLQAPTESASERTAAPQVKQQGFAGFSFEELLSSTVEEAQKNMNAFSEQLKIKKNLPEGLVQQILSIQEVFDEAQKEFTAGSQKEAFLLFRRANRLAQDMLISLEDIP